MFEVDFRKLVVLLLPTFWRERKFIAWLYSLVAPVRTIHYNFMQLRERHWYDLQHNGQVCYLEKALNDSFDNELRRIEIGEGSSTEQTYIYTHAENRPVYLSVYYLQSRAEIKKISIDFVVKIPQDVYEREKQTQEDGKDRFFNIEDVVNYYKLAGKRYEIILK